MVAAAAAAAAAAARAVGRRRAGLGPDVRSYAATIGAVGKGVVNASASDEHGVEWWRVACSCRRGPRKAPLRPPPPLVHGGHLGVLAGGQWRPALLLDEMEMMGIQPDVVAFNAVLYSCRLGAQWRCSSRRSGDSRWVGGWVGG